MKHVVKGFLLAPLVIAMATVTTGAAAVTETPKERTITFVQLNDLHANLVGHKELVRNADGTTSIAMRGGLARMKTVIDQVRAENEDTLVMNIGDTFHGGVEAFYSLGNAIGDPLNAMSIDIGVPGNWDYYFTPGVTRARYGRIEEEIMEVTIPMLADPIPIKRPDFPNLGANVRDMTDALPQDFLPATHMFDRDGIKVGFIGFTSDIVEMMHPMLAQGMDFAWGKEEHAQLLIENAQKLRDQGADVVAVMSELGIHKDVALSKALAEMVADGTLPAGLIDVIFSAHTHEVTSTPLTNASDGTVLYAPVVEAGNDSYLGRMDITLQYDGSTTSGRRFNQTTEQNWSSRDMQWELITIDESVPEDREIQKLVETARAPFLAEQVNYRALPFIAQRLTQPIDTVIGHLPPGSVLRQNAAMSGVLTRQDSLDSSFNAALSTMMMDVTGADIALTPGFRMGATIPEAGYLMENGVVADGNITLEDAYRFFPMYYGLATGTTTGAHLKEVMESALRATYSADTWNTQGGWNYGYAGMDITVDLAAGDTHRVLALHRADGSVINDSDELTVGGCRRLPIDFNGVLCGLAGFENVKIVRNPETGMPWSLVDVFVQKLQNEGYPLMTSASNVTDQSNTLRWPDSEFIQPIEGVGEFIVPQDPNDPCGFFKWNCINN